MFSGKSSYAVSYARRQRAIGKKVLIVKPDIDTRFNTLPVLQTHDDECLPCKVWDTRKPLCEMTELSYDCYVIEEAQFFTHLRHFCEHMLRELHKDILVVGLDGCAQQKTFGEICDVIPLATTVQKRNALCSVCRDGTLAPYTKKLGTMKEQVDVGGAEKYVAVCLRHL